VRERWRRWRRYRRILHWLICVQLDAGYEVNDKVLARFRAEAREMAGGEDGDG